ncbi:hypothetical protein GRI34_01030 [Erythrobacter aquimaris]|uniref:Uncharacterized protein n=1 Tax=Qipengyuania aquimaris TaxID=255984 RepID=A0A6I4TK95_9SPHN|nr:hypothetical protein [Qipengyuania aquimaris]MXO94998.1 hypothetical protein [Qipengyuania aquimaris]
MDFPVTETTIIVSVAIMTVGYLVSNWMKIKNGYPLENSWGKSVYPKNDQAVERVKLLTQENAELRAELGSLKDRLGNVERIVTDSGYHLTNEIDRLRDKSEAN